MAVEETSFNPNYKVRYFQQFTEILTKKGLNYYLDNSIYGAHFEVAKKIFKENKTFGIGIKNFRVESFSDEYNIGLINTLLNQGINFTEEKLNDNLLLKNQIWVITGVLSNYSRDQAKELIQSYGGKVMNSVSNKTNYLLAGKSAGSKLVKAKDLGVMIINENDFSKMMDQ